VLDLGWRALMVGVVFLVDAIVFVQLLREDLRERRSAVAQARPRFAAGRHARAVQDQDGEPSREAA